MTHFLPKEAAMERDVKEHREQEGKRYGAQAIEDNALEVFENRFPERDYLVEFSFPEFTALCPRSGYPDFAKIAIDYIPGPFCVELKALKLYLNSFRDQNIFHEDVANTLLNDLVAVCEPKFMKVIADFHPRGNLHTEVVAAHDAGGSNVQGQSYSLIYSQLKAR